MEDVELKLKLRNELNRLYLDKYEELPCDVVLTESILALIALSIIFNYDTNVVVDEWKKGFVMAEKLVEDLEIPPLLFLPEVAEA